MGRLVGTAETSRSRERPERMILHDREPCPVGAGWWIVPKELDLCMPRSAPKDGANLGHHLCVLGGSEDETSFRLCSEPSLPAKIGRAGDPISRPPARCWRYDRDVDRDARRSTECFLWLPR